MSRKRRGGSKRSRREQSQLFRDERRTREDSTALVPFSLLPRRTQVSHASKPSLGMSWHSTLQLLSLPIPHLLIGPYASPSPLPPLSPTSFLPTTPLTTRLRHTDLILYSLLTTLDPSLLRTLPSWPPLTQLDSKAFKAELGKVVEQLLKKENKRGLGWEREVSWRRSYLDEAKGDKWEHVLLWLTTLALRRVVEEQRNVLQGTSRAVEVHTCEFWTDPL